MPEIRENSAELKRGGFGPEYPAEPVSVSAADTVPETRKAFLCRFCGLIITFPDMQIEINGTVRHVFTNPSGIVYEISCFSSARGCVVLGEPTEEFTWFPGFLWSFAVCSQCRNHLGWFYQAGGSSFYGLVSAYLVENG